MAPKNPDLQKHTLNLRRGDIDYLDSVYRSRGVPVSMIIRDLISGHVDKLRANEPPITVSDLL